MGYNNVLVASPRRRSKCWLHALPNRVHMIFWKLIASFASASGGELSVVSEKWSDCQRLHFFPQRFPMAAAVLVYIRITGITISYGGGAFYVVWMLRSIPYCCVEKKKLSVAAAASWFHEILCFISSLWWTLHSVLLWLNNGMPWLHALKQPISDHSNLPLRSEERRKK